MKYFQSIFTQRRKKEHDIMNMTIFHDFLVLHTMTTDSWGRQTYIHDKVREQYKFTTNGFWLLIKWIITAKFTYACNAQAFLFKST